MSVPTSANAAARMEPDPTVDSYELWLRGRARRATLSAYELLSLQPFESNPTRIRAAVDRVRAMIARHVEGKAPELWSEYRKAFDEAADTLLDRQRKELLDASLRRQSGTAKLSLADCDRPPGDAPGDAATMESSTSTIGCPRCRHVNAADRKFCSACGESLWDACPKCRAVRPNGERFCGQCGLDVAAHLAAQSTHLDEQIALARRLQSEGNFHDARRIVRELARIDDPRAESHARQALQLIDEFVVDRQLREARTVEAIQQAQRLLDEHSYTAAIEALADIPAALDTADSRRIRSDATARQREAEQLLASISEGLERKQTHPLLPLIERFLTLKPGHAHAQKLASRIAEQVFAAAKRLAQDGKSEVAIEMLRTIPTFAATDATRQLADECQERVWLMRESRDSSVLHPSLPAIVQRLVEQLPARADLAKRHEELRARQTAGPDAVWRAVPDWAARPARSSVGMPVEWIGGFPRMAIAKGVTPNVPRHALSRLCVAMGLALQAIGQSTVDVNLADTPPAGMLSRLGLGFRRRPTTTTGWGVDLSPSAVKAVRLKWDEAGQRATIEAVELIERESRGAAEDAAATEVAMVELLRQLASRQDFSGTRLAVNLPPMQCLSKCVLLPGAPPGKLKDLIQYEAKQRIPVPLDELVLQHVAAGGGESGDEGILQSWRVLLLATRRITAAKRAALFEQAGLHPEILQNDCVALHNYVQFDLLSAPPSASPALPDRSVAVLDLGGDASSFLVSGHEGIWYRTFVTGGDEFTKAMSRELKLTWQQAEVAKRAPQRVRRLSTLSALWEPLMTQVRAECRRSLDEWKKFDSGTAPSRLLCVGGAAQTYGLVDALRS